MPIKIITDSTSYIPENLRKEFDVSIVSLSVVFTGFCFTDKTDFDNNRWEDRHSW